MTRKKLMYALTAVLVALSLAAPLDAAAANRSTKITSVTSKPGARPGQVQINWRSSGSNPTSFVVETALTTFSPSRGPVHGRHWKTFKVSGKKRSLTLTAAQVAAAGAPLGSGRHLYFRLKAVTGKSARWYPYQQSVSVNVGRPISAASGTALRVANFNVKSSKTSGRSWLSRAPKVAATIKAKNPAIVTIQELSPGRADGKGGSTNGSVRQTNSLQNSLKKAGAGKYRLVRSTPYIMPGKKHGTQGTRILYDTSRYSVVSRCSEKTGKRSYSSSCSLELPILSGESASNRRSAAYAILQNKSTKKRVLVVSAHLDARHSSKVATEKRYDRLRTAQVQTIVAKIARVNTHRVPVVFGGDINSWQNNRVANGPHDRLVAGKFYDTAAAQSTANLRYSTYNDMTKTMKPSPSGYGSRLDVIAVRGLIAAKRFENVMKVRDSARPSDHNMVYADIVLKA